MTHSPYRYSQGLRDGIPVGLAYLSVSFGFGITAIASGFSAIQAVLISMTNLTSAGQVAGAAIFAAGGLFLELILTQIVINARYALMGITLTQKLSPECTTRHRLLMSFGITDEIFAIAVSKEHPVGPAYFYGLMTAPYLGWSLGTALGAFAGQLLPESIRTALGILIYAMFLSIMLPSAKKSFGVLLTILFAIGFSCCFHFIPPLSAVPEGYVIILSSILSAILVSFIRPVKEEEEHEA
ncbi:MAG: AzlC family ABC transporter permease [Clostridia bacterium]|nr:AzlC family ABC transporter permease [Clostridia bacterium]